MRECDKRTRKLQKKPLVMAFSSCIQGSITIFILVHIIIMRCSAKEKEVRRKNNTKSKRRQVKEKCLYFFLECVYVCSVVSDSLRPTPWAVSHQARLPMEFSRQEYWSGLSFPFPGNLPDPGIEPASPALAGILEC